MARSRKPSDDKDEIAEDAADHAHAERDGVEDAEIIEETGPDGESAESPDAPVSSTEPDPGLAGSEAGPGDIEGPDAQDRPGESIEGGGGSTEIASAPQDEPSSTDGEPVEDVDREFGAESGESAEEQKPDATDDASAEHEEPPHAPPPVVQPATSSSSGPSILALIFGGIVAALIGAIAVLYGFPQLVGGQNEETLARLDALDARIEDVDTRLSAEADARADVMSALDALRGELSEAVEGLEGELAALPDDTPRLDAIDARIDDLLAGIEEARASFSSAADRISADVETIGDRVEVLELRPAPEALDAPSLDEALTAFQQELSAAVDGARADMLAAQEEATRVANEAAEAAAERERQAAEVAAAREAEAAAEAEALRAEAEAAAQALREEAEAAAEAAAERAAAARVVAAVENGEPFAADLAVLDAAEVPDVLSARAEAGVPTLVELQEAFPDAARSALQASLRSEVDGSMMDRAMAFLRVQSGVRSLEARDGDDPDAVLSRAEASLRAGDLAGALAELDGLPEAGRDVLAPWVEDARARLEAEDAAAALLERTNGN